MIEKKVLKNNLKRFILIGIISNIINFGIYFLIVVFLILRLLDQFQVTFLVYFFHFILEELGFLENILIVDI